MERLIFNPELRRALIRNGLLVARKQTLDRFIDTVVGALKTDLPVEPAALPQEQGR
jgi:hypothetical protein